MKDFRYIYACHLRKIQLSEGETKQVPIEDIIPATKDWKDTIWMYRGLMKRIDRGVGYQKSAWHKNEIHNQTKDIQKRFNRFKKLYRSIRKNGFELRKYKHIKLLDIRKLKPKNPLKGGRINWKYYRINGMKRILICKYLGIKKIPCKVYHVRKG
jgi:hypothetical protein